MAASVENGVAKEKENQMDTEDPEVLKKRVSLSTIMENRIDALGSGESREFIWGCELNKDITAATWTFGAAEEEGDDTDFLIHTLYLRHAVLGSGATKDEKNIVQVETRNFQGDEVKMPIGVLTVNQKDMCMFDLNFGHDIPVTFRLLEGSGPVYLVGQHAVEWPRDDRNLMNDTATETETEAEEPVIITKGKRKASRSPRKGVSKRGRLDDVEEVTDEDEETEETEEESMDEEDEEEEEEDSDDEEEEESEEEEEEEESEEEVVTKKKGRKAKGKEAKTAPAKQTKKTAKTTKAKPAKGKGKRK